MSRTGKALNCLALVVTGVTLLAAGILGMPITDRWLVFWGIGLIVVGINMSRDKN